RSGPDLYGDRGAADPGARFRRGPTADFVAERDLPQRIETGRGFGGAAESGFWNTGNDAGTLGGGRRWSPCTKTPTWPGSSSERSLARTSDQPTSVRRSQ